MGSDSAAQVQVMTLSQFRFLSWSWVQKHKRMVRRKRKRKQITRCGPRHPMDDAAAEPALFSEEEAFNCASSLEKDPAGCSTKGPLRRSNAFEDEP